MAPPPPSIDLDCERHRLDNGLRVVLHRDTTLPLVAINLWYHVGSKDERPGRTGLAHLFEHMLFQGSENVGTNDHFRYVQQVGGVANGSTWYDRTNYYETLPAHHLELGLWLESDRMGCFLPALTEEKLANQREVVMNERRQRVDNQPYGLAFERLHELLYPEDHPYHWPVIGYMDDIAAATMADVEAFFRRYYAPNNAVLSLVGDFEPAEALASVRHYFDPIPPGPGAAAPAVPPRPPAGARRLRLEDEVNLPRLYLAWDGPAYGADEWYAGHLLAVALSGGRSSPLHHDLVYDRQVARDVSAYLFPTELAATFVVVATARPGVELATLEDAVRRHLDAATAAELAATTVERARNQLLTSYFAELETVDRRADLLSQFTTLFDDPRRLGREVERYVGLTGTDLARFAAAHLGAERQACVEVVPREAR